MTCILAFSISFNSWCCFLFFKSIPAPQEIAGVLGIVGVFVGYKLVEFIS